MKLSAVKNGASRLGAAWNSADVGIHGAATAYATLFSLAPLLIIALAVAGLFLDPQVVQRSIASQFGSTFGQNGASMIETLISAARPTSGTVITTIFGIIAIILGSIGIFSVLQSALNRIFDHMPEKQTARGVWRVILDKLVSIGMVLSLGFVLVASLVASAAFTALGGQIARFIPGGEAVAFLLEIVVSYVLTSLFLGLIMKYLPSKKIPSRTAIAGGLIAGAFFMIGKYALGLYLGSSHAANAYGAASAVVLLVLWTYYISQAFFLSAIIARLYFLPPRDIH